MVKVKQTDDIELAKEIKAHLKENDNYCPCRLQKTPDTKCMCKEFREMIEKEESGICHCGLYVITVE